jgi:hypothetical protein
VFPLRWHQADIIDSPFSSSSHNTRHKTIVIIFGFHSSTHQTKSTMKLTIAAATLIAARSAQAACDSQMTIDVPGGIIGLTFVGYNVDESKIVRSTGSVR